MTPEALMERHGWTLEEATAYLAVWNSDGDKYIPTAAEWIAEYRRGLAASPQGSTAPTDLRLY